MAKWDPKAARDQQDNSGVPASDYLLVLRNFARKRSNKNGEAYLRGRYEVIAGPAKGKQFFDSIGLDISNQGVAFRLSLFAEACGATEAFDLDDDAELRDKLCNKPFKARVKRTVNGPYVNNGIERYAQAKDVSQHEQELMNIWSMEWEEKRQYGGGDGGPPQDDISHAAAGDQYGYGGGGGGGGSSYGPDDDIPF